jgi:hypothetical protein
MKLSVLWNMVYQYFFDKFFWWFKPVLMIAQILKDLKTGLSSGHVLGPKDT